MRVGSHLFFEVRAALAFLNSYKEGKHKTFHSERVGSMQKLDDKRIRIIPKSAQNVPGPSASRPGLSFLGFFTSSRTESRGKTTSTILKEPAAKSFHSGVSRADLAAVKGWVALEEKIVHDYKERKTVLPENPAKQSQPLPPKGSALSSFFSAPRPEPRIKNPAAAPKESVLNRPHSGVPRADLTAVKGWVALEEKIVHGYKEQKTALTQSAPSLPKSPVKQSRPVVENFATQTSVSLLPSVPKHKTSFRGSGKVFPVAMGFFLVCGWLAAGIFIFLHVQGTLSNREIFQKFTQLQNDKKQLEQSYAALKGASEDQRAEVVWLDGQLRGVALELRTAKADRVAYEKGLEKKYRQELMRITVHYESEIAALRGTVRTQDAIVNALKAQNQVFDKIIDQMGVSAVSGAAAGLSQEPFSASRSSTLQGAVASVNERQGFVVLNAGASQGVTSGRWIAISRSGVGLAVGRVDRVYPTMSVAVLRNTGMLQVVQEGDSVSFS